MSLLPHFLLFAKTNNTPFTLHYVIISLLRHFHYDASLRHSLRHFIISDACFHCRFMNIGHLRSRHYCRYYHYVTLRLLLRLFIYMPSLRRHIIYFLIVNIEDVISLRASNICH